VSPQNQYLKLQLSSVVANPSGAHQAGRVFTDRIDCAACQRADDGGVLARLWSNSVELTSRFAEVAAANGRRGNDVCIICSQPKRFRRNL